MIAVLGTAVAALRGSNGADSPEAAVRQFLAAAANEDIPNAARLLPPNEIGSAPDLYDLIIKVAQKNDALGPQGKPLSGIDIEFRDLSFEVASLSPRVSRVEFTGGELVIDLKAAQLDPKVRGFMEDYYLRDRSEDSHDIVTVDRMNRTVREAREALSSEMDIATGAPNSASGLFLMTTRVDGRWYVSYQYTLLEFFRTVVGGDLPSFTEPKLGAGADNPDGVIKAMTEELNKLTAEELSRRLTEGSPAGAPQAGVFDVAEFWAFSDYAEVFRRLNPGGYRFDPHPPTGPSSNSNG